MKKIKVSTFAVIALLIGIVGSAFTPTPASPPPDLAWYEFTTGVPENASNYQKATIPPSCASAVSDVCAIMVNDNGTTPDQADVDALVSQTDDFAEESELVKYRP